MKNYRAELLTLGLKMLRWRSAIIRNRKWKTKQNTENVPDLKRFDGWNGATNRRRIIDCPDRRNADIEYTGTKCFLPFLCKVETSCWPMRIVPSFIAACISNNTSLPEWQPNWFDWCDLVNVTVNAFHSKIEIEHHHTGKRKKSATERLEVAIFSPFPASCTQLATENCRRSRAICSDSSGTAQRGGGETVRHLYNRSRLPTVSTEQLNEPELPNFYI